VGEIHRVIFCLISVFVAYIGVVISSAWEPAARLLHRWSYGVLAAFLVIFAVSMFLTLRGKLVNSPWMIPICAALGYPTGMLAYVIYFGAFEPQRLANSLGHGQETGTLVALFFLGATGSFVWLFGAIAGAVFFLLQGDLINLALHPLSMAVRRGDGLVLKGTVDEVRKFARFAKFLPIRGVEITGYDRPENPSCAFISELQKVQYVRLFAGPLKNIESVQSLPRLRHLAILHTAKDQVIAIDFASLPELERVALQWFEGAEGILHARQLRSLDLLDWPLSNSHDFGKLDRLISLRFSVGRLADTRGFKRLLALRWLGLHHQRELTDFSGLSRHPSLGFLWIEACPNLGNIEWLADMPQLETLRILDCGEISGVEALRSLPRLRHVHIHGSTRVRAANFAFLQNMANLESVFINGLPKPEATYWARRNKKYDLLRSEFRGWPS
jgi:hypothetical protein